jgi:antitoxin component YwqK of YwqJK toxin-antitoxin module
MRPIFLITFLCSMLTLGFSPVLASDEGRLQNQKKTNQTDENGLKQGYWIYYGKDIPKAGIPNSGKVEEGPFEDDRKEGIWIKYHNDGLTPKLRGTYVNNRPQGAYVKIHPNGSIKEVGTFERNAYKDSLKRFHENGILEFEAKFNDKGREEGKVVYYYPNGKVEFEYNSVNGKPVGDAKRFYENGDVKELIVYDEFGKLKSSEQKEMVTQVVTIKNPNASKETAPKVKKPDTKGVAFMANGYNKIYNSNDEIWQDGEFKAGVLIDGRLFEYDNDGILLRVKVFKEGVYHSDGQL